MKYVYTAGPYRTFRGYVFCNGNPVSILDKATLIAIAREPGFSMVTEPLPETKAPVMVRVEPAPRRSILGLRRNR